MRTKPIPQLTHILLLVGAVLIWGRPVIFTVFGDYGLVSWIPVIAGSALIIASLLIFAKRERH